MISNSVGSGRKTVICLLSYSFSRTPLKSVWELPTEWKGKEDIPGEPGTEDEYHSTGEEKKWNFRKGSKKGKGLGALKGVWLTRAKRALDIKTREQQGFWSWSHTSGDTLETEGSEEKRKRLKHCRIQVKRGDCSQSRDNEDPKDRASPLLSCPSSSRCSTGLLYIRHSTSAKLSWVRTDM